MKVPLPLHSYSAHCPEQQKIAYMKSLGNHPAHTIDVERFLDKSP